MIKIKTRLVKNLVFILFNIKKNMSKKIAEYNPLFLLAALWPGWMSIVFFMYLMFIVPRDTKDFVIPTFDSLKIYFTTGGNENIAFKILIVLSVLWIMFFAFKHLQLLVWNLKRYFEFKKTKQYEVIKTGNAEVTLMALPLTLAMTINVVFVLWAVFVPGLWWVVDYLFPLAIISFWAVWILALRTFWEYFSRLMIQKWNSDFVDNNSLSQMVSVFAFVMIAVWFAASAAMWNPEFMIWNIEVWKITILLWLWGSIFFVTIAIFLSFLKVILGFKAIFKYWLDEVASPTLWIMIPILTLIWITFVRQSHWLHEIWGHTIPSTFIVLTSVIISLQILFWYLGYKVMKANKYFEKFIYGKEKSVWSYALICPWVALVVLGFFFLHLGLVKSGVVPKFGYTYFVFLIPLVYLQFKTIAIMLRLNKKFFNNN